MVDHKILFTKATFESMQARQKKLLVLQEEVKARLKTAREMGDLSENGAYKYAKFELGNIRRELNRLNFLLANGQVGMVKKHYDQIEFGCTFTLLNQDKSMVFTLVSEYESDPSAHKLSPVSPIGQAVYQKKVGDTVQVKTPRGPQEFEIVAIE